MEAEVSEQTQSTPAEATQVETQTVEQTQEVTQTNEQEGKPSGFDRVEFTPEQKTRVDRIYGNMKRYENEAKDLKTDNQRLLDTVNQLIQGQQQIVSHIQVNDFQKAQSTLEQKVETAWNSGDFKGYQAAMNELSEIKIQKVLADREAKQRPQQTKQPQQRTVSGNRLVDAAVDHNEISPVDANISRAWMSETDPAGNLKRSWTQEGDPRNYEAALVGKAVFESPNWVDKSIAEKFREIDRRMGTQPQAQGQNVLGAGNLTRGKQNNNIQLDQKIIDVAVKTKFAGRDPKLTDQDHINAWQKAVQKSQPKGARK